MGKQINGIIGTFSGKVGDVVGSSWRGQSYVKRMPKKSDKPKSEKQLAQQRKFAMVVKFLQPVKDLLTISFGLKHKAATGFNLAVQYHLKNAIIGICPHFDIDYSKVIFGKGFWGQPECVELLREPGSLIVSWFVNGYRLNSYGDDDIYILVYVPEMNTYLKGPAGVKRAEGIAMINIPESYEGKSLHTYLYCVSRRGDMSNSVYAGEVSAIKPGLTKEMNS